MAIRITVVETLREQFDSFLSAQDVTPEIVAEGEGHDGSSIWMYILEYGPDTLELLTALMIFWNEIRKASKKGEDKKIEITLETDRHDDEP